MLRAVLRDSPGWGRTLGAAPAVLALALGGCGDEGGAEGGDLAAMAPSDAVLYFEGAVRPEGDQQEAIEAVASRFPGGDELGNRIVEDFDRSLAEDTAPGEDPPSYADDVEPWLGERFAFFLTGFAAPTDGEDPPAAAVAEATDPDAATDAVEHLVETSKDEERRRETMGYTYYVGPDGSAAGVVGDHVVAASTEEDFQKVIDVVEGQRESLADSDDFSYSVGDEDGSGALAFVELDTRTVVDSAIAAQADVDPAQVASLAGDAGIDLDSPARLALTASDDQATLDLSVGTTGEGSPTAGELLGSLPADAWLAGTCPRCLDALAAGFNLAIEQEAAASGVGPQEAQRAVRESFGLDPGELVEALGGSAFFVRGTSPLDLGGAVVAEVDDRSVVEDGVDAARTVIQSEAPPEVSISDLPDLPVDASGFKVGSAGIPFSLNVAVSDDRLVVGFGDESTARAFDPDDTLEASGAIDDAESDLGSGFETSALIDLDSAFGAFTNVPDEASSDVATARPYLEPFASAAVGTREEGERLIARAVVTFD